MSTWNGYSMGDTEVASAEYWGSITVDMPGKIVFIHFLIMLYKFMLAEWTVLLMCQAMCWCVECMYTGRYSDVCNVV